MIEVFKLTSGIYDTQLPAILRSSNESRTRGHSKKLLHERPKKDLRKYFFTNRITSVWNALPENVINSKNTKIFEHRLDKFWSSQDRLHHYKSNLTTGNDFEIDELEELSIVACKSQRLEEDL